MAKYRLAGVNPFGKEPTIQITADKVNEETQTEYSINNRRDAGEIIHGDTHQADQKTLFRVLAQVDAGQHSQGKARGRHQKDHQHRAEDGRKQSSVLVRLAWIG